MIKRRCKSCDKWFEPNAPQRKSCFTCKPKTKDLEYTGTRPSQIVKIRSDENAKLRVLDRDPNPTDAFQAFKLMEKRCR